MGSDAWSLYVPLFGAMVNLGLFFWKHNTHPWNLVVLSTFTLLEAPILGGVVAFDDNKIMARPYEFAFSPM
ncbi:hypothetical protein PTI98_006035 [Pleurotus ostreatus]|nr:hypothetical protein PTI98_006035 [Pleurotus ostreatus]